MSRRIGLFAFASLIALALVSLWFALLPQRLSSALSQAFEHNTGLGMAVIGPASLTFGDGLGVTFADVRIANAQLPKGLRIEAEKLSFPLASGNIMGGLQSLPRATLEGAVASLDLGVPLHQSQSGKGDALGVDSGATTTAFAIRFESSILRLTDISSRFQVELSDASGVLERNAANQLLVHMSGLLNGIYTTLHLEADDAAKLFSEGAPADIVLSSDNGELRFSGRAGWKSGIALDGRLFAASRKTASLLSWVGLPSALAPQTAFELETAFSASKSKARLPGLSLKLGTSAGNGDFTISYQQDGIAFDGVLNAGDVELSQLWPDLAVRTDWSSSPFSWLPLPDAKGKLQVNTPKLIYERWPLREARTVIELTDQAAELSINAADGKIVLSASATRTTPPVFGLSAKFAQLPSQQALKAIAGYSWLAGIADVELDATSTGNNPASIVSSLGGNASMILSDGAVDGYSIRDLLIEGGKGWRSAQGDATPGLSVSIKCDIADGIVTLLPAKVKAEELELTVAGEVDLLRQALDIEVATDGNKGLPKKTSLSGSWYDPDFGAATAQSGQEPEQAPSAN